MMIVLATVALVAIAFVAAASFWAVARLPAHLRLRPVDSTELGQIIQFLGQTELLEEAKRIEPLLGSYAKNIATWDHAHLRSLRKTRNLLLVLMAADLLAAYFVSRWCFFTIIAVLAAAALFPLPGSAKNNNVTHVHTIVLNLIKWYQ